MTIPLVLLALFAAFCAVGGETGPLYTSIAASRPLRAAPPAWPTEMFIDAHHIASLWGLVVGATGAAAALIVYAAGLVDERRSAAFLGSARQFFNDGWHLDEFYRRSIIRLLGMMASALALWDRVIVDGALHGIGRMTIALARLDRTFDERVVDGFVNQLAATTYAAGRSLRAIQTGQLRQYVMALAAAAVVLFALAVIAFPRS